MDLQLKGKRALVTGSSSGIGIGIARALLDEGADVVVHGRNVERTHGVAADLEQYGRVGVALGDLATDDGADATAEAAVAAFGGIDILVNNAGGASYSEVGFFNVKAADWVTTYGMNVISAVNMINRLVPQMKELGWGRIIQLSSYAAASNTGTTPAYTATKSALLNLTLGLAKSLRNTGITVNAVAPGLIYTDALGAYLDAIGQSKGWGDDREKSIDYMINNLLPQTVERIGTPEDVGSLVAFLCSPKADFISAANMRVDGGAATSTN